MSASSADESSPRNDRRVLRLAAIEKPDQDQEDAVSDEYDSEHAESLLSIERVAARPTSSPDAKTGNNNNNSTNNSGTNASSNHGGGGSSSSSSKSDNSSKRASKDKLTEAISPNSWSDVKI